MPRSAYAGILTLLMVALTVVTHPASAQISRFRSARFNAEPYVAVADLARHFELGGNQSDYGRRVVYRSLIVEVDRRDIQIQGINHWLNKPVVQAGGELWISKTDVVKTVDPILRPQQFYASRPVTTIVIDPGHGGADRGTRGRTGKTEKELTLDLSRRVESRLVQNGLRVLLTRRGDATLSLPARTDLARAKGAQLFVSLHFNAAGSAARGIETFCLPPKGYSSTSSPRLRASDQRLEPGNRNDPQNMWLAHSVHQSLMRATVAPDRGVRRARFQVLREASCPAILVEAGFLSNAHEETRILTVRYRDTLANAIAEGIITYVKSTGR